MVAPVVPAAAALALTGSAVGCAAMVSMLPGAAAGALGALGVTASSAFARTLSPAAEPLFVGSAVGLTLAALTCSRLVCHPLVLARVPGRTTS